MRNSKLILVLVLLTTVLGTVFGAQSDYRITNLGLDLKLSRDAVLSVSEGYVFDYQGPHHGFVRELPVDYSADGVSRRVKVSKIVCTDPYSTSSENGWLSLRIGDADKTIVGEKTYALSFYYDMGADTNKGYDEFYYNLVGSDWDCPIDKVVFSVYIPCRYSDVENMIFLTRGSYGSTEGVPFYTYSDGSDSFTITATVENFAPNEGLTLRVQFPDGWYTNARKPFDARAQWAVISPIISVVCLVLCLIIWVLKGHDRVPIITARFNAPEDFSPLVEGFLADGNVDDKDITSMLYYWADKGYMTISEVRKNNFVFTKIADLPFDVPDFERKLFYGFFQTGDVVTMKDLEKSSFYEKMNECKLKLASYFTRDKKLKTTSSLVFSFVSFFISILPVLFASFSVFMYEGLQENAVGLGLVSLFFCAIMLLMYKLLFRKWYLRKSNTFSLFLTEVPAFLFILLMTILPAERNFVFLLASVCENVCIFLASITDKRSKYGNEVFEGTLGYREFIDKVQVSELVTMIDKDPMIYYRVLSYAIVFRLEKKWAKKFEAVTIAPPVWFTGNTAFNYLYFTNMASRMNRAVKDSVVKAVSSQHSSPGSRFGGSSFGSMGFSGGGFGGGGGHAW